MSINLNRVDHAGLVRHDGKVAFHAHYADELDASSLGIFFRDLGEYHLQPGSIPMQPLIDQARRVITLVPCEPTTEIRPFKEISTRIGYDGPLHFIDPDGCKPIKETSYWPH